MIADTDFNFAEVKPQRPAQLLDRSTLERWVECPMAARLHRDEPSEAKDIGTACHDVISDAILSRVVYGLTARDLVEAIKASAEIARSDIQPRVVEFMRRGAWSVVDAFCRDDLGQERHVDDVIAFDGGEGRKSGQLACDLEIAGKLCRLTAELDLLMATASEHEVVIHDWKSGWTHWTGTEVKRSFQFRFYAWLVFRNFPLVTRVGVRVLMLGKGEATSTVYFSVEDSHAIEAQIRTAVAVKAEHESSPMAKVPAYPDSEKCGRCDVVTRCLHANEVAQHAATDAVGYLGQLVALTAKAKAMQAALSLHVRTIGHDIRTPAGDAFGIEAPKKSARQPACKLYSKNTEGDE